MKKITERILMLAIFATALMACDDSDVVSDTRNGLQPELDESGKALLGAWNLVYDLDEPSEGRMITFNDDGSCTMTEIEGDLALPLNYSYSIHQEDGYIPSFYDQGLHYYYYLRLLPSTGMGNGWIDEDWGIVVHGNYLYMTLIHRRYFITHYRVYKRAGANDDESVIILDGTWNLLESHLGTATAKESITFDGKGTCIRTDSEGNTINGRYSVHEEEGELSIVHNDSKPYKYYLRIQEQSSGDVKTRDWGIVFGGARIYLTPIHELNERGECYVYEREDHPVYTADN